MRSWAGRFAPPEARGKGDRRQMGCRARLAKLVGCRSVVLDSYVASMTETPVALTRQPTLSGNQVAEVMSETDSTRRPHGGWKDGGEDAPIDLQVRDRGQQSSARRQVAEMEVKPSR